MKLIQFLREERYSLSNLRVQIQKDLESVKALNEYQECLVLLDKYRSTKYKYASKNKRIAAIEQTNEELITLALAAIAIGDEIKPIQSVASYMASSMGGDVIPNIKTCAEILAVGSESDLWDILGAGMHGESISIARKYELEEHTLEIINRIKYMPPMVCKPKKVNSNVDTSHIIVKGHLILGKENNHELPQDYEAINIANRVALSLDEHILEYKEIPSKKLDTPEKKAQFKQLCKSSTEVYQEVFNLNNKFWLTWKYDFRGRMYSQGYYVNIQSYDYKKALIGLHKKEIIQ